MTTSKEGGAGASHWTRSKGPISGDPALLLSEQKRKKKQVATVSKAIYVGTQPAEERAKDAMSDTESVTMAGLQQFFQEQVVSLLQNQLDKHDEKFTTLTAKFDNLSQQVSIISQKGGPIAATPLEKQASTQPEKSRYPCKAEKHRA
ncbi:unnamed protein product [Linum trigynum]|uniref:Uncharacterized protein n=1 Tax=Linum trigynum TaxID=586398 RepID=A0AAV2G6D1_9ROSI